MMKLIPCPTCGGTTLALYRADGNRKFYIECLRCHRRGKTKMFEFRAIRAWNRRADNG